MVREQVSRLKNNFLASCKFSFGSIEELLYLFITLPVFLACLSANSNGDFFFAQRAGLFFFLALIVGRLFVNRYGLLVGGFFTYCMVSAGYSGIWRDNNL